MKLSIIAAIARNNALGLNNQLLYHLPDDLKRFKKLTSGHTVIMGRKTFESLPNGALLNRKNIVISSTLTELPGCEIYHSLSEAIESVKNEDEVFIIGGATLYKEAIKTADKLYMTEIYDTPENADVFFPEIPVEFDAEYATMHDADDRHSVPFAFVDYVRQK